MMVGPSLKVLLSVSILRRCHALPEIEIPDCLALTTAGEATCIDASYGWCVWNSDHSVCLLTTKVKVDAMFIDWWNMGINSFWIIMIPIIYVLIFELAKFICDKLLQKDLIQQSYYEKCCVYTFEVLCVVPIWFNCLYPVFGYAPIFTPDKYEHVSPELWKDHFAAITFVGSSLCIMYLLEIMFARDMRWQLKTHHWVTILTIILTAVALNQRASLDVARVGMCLTFYATFETHVFLQLLFYRIFPSKFVIFHYLSAYMYVLTRTFTMVILLVCFIQWASSWGDFIFSNDVSDTGFAYVFYFFYIAIANFVLNFVQLSSMKALFFMAEKVYYHSKLRSQLKTHPRLQELYDIYISYDDVSGANAASQRTEWTVEQLDQFLQDYCQFHTKNSPVTKIMFEALLLTQKKQYFIKKLSDKQKRRVKGIRWKMFLYLFKTEMIYVSEKVDTKHIVTQKINLLVAGVANQVNANPGATPSQMTRDASDSKASGKTVEADGAKATQQDKEFADLIALVSDSIEHLNDIAMDGIVNISRAHEKDKVLKKLESVSSSTKSALFCFYFEFCVLFILRCVLCRLGRKTKYVLHDVRSNRDDIDHGSKITSGTKPSSSGLVWADTGVVSNRDESSGSRASSAGIGALTNMQITSQHSMPSFGGDASTNGPSQDLSLGLEDQPSPEGNLSVSDVRQSGQLRRASFDPDMRESYFKRLSSRNEVGLQKDSQSKLDLVATQSGTEDSDGKGDDIEKKMVVAVDLSNMVSKRNGKVSSNSAVTSVMVQGGGKEMLEMLAVSPSPKTLEFQNDGKIFKE